ncbi:MAG: hypothetical protein WCP85_17385 [Mariniphaga sp.]
MNRPEIPAVVESARRRPISFNPVTGTFILYDDVANGSLKIVSLEKLSSKELISLSVERYLADDPGTTIVLTGQSFTKKQLADEIMNQTAIGKQMFDIDIEYLRFYLSQFPQECFEQ